MNSTNFNSISYGSDANAMLMDDYSFEVDDIFHQINEHDAAMRITRGVRRAARRRRMVNAHYYLHERPRHPLGVIRHIQSYLR